MCTYISTGHIHRHTHTHTCMHVHTRTCSHTHTHIHTYIHMHTDTHTHTHTHTWPGLVYSCQMLGHAAPETGESRRESSREVSTATRKPLRHDAVHDFNFTHTHTHTHTTTTTMYNCHKMATSLPEAGDNSEKKETRRIIEVKGDRSTHS